MAIALATASATAGVALATSAEPSDADSAAAASRCRLPVFGPGRDYRPAIVPRTFSPRVTNPYFPLKTGRTLVYTGIKDGKRAIDLVVATSRVKIIAGVRSRVVEDRLYLNGVLQERTSDYYAQDRCGNVWYFGEDTAELDRQGRVVSTEGSWRAGVGGAQPGVVMQAHPQVGRRFREEWLEGHAEDVFRATALSVPVTVRLGSFRNALRTEETNALEPAVVDNKYYVRGVGEVVELSVKGPRETLRLAEIIS